MHDQEKILPISMSGIMRLSKVRSKGRSNVFIMVTLYIPQSDIEDVKQRTYISIISRPLFFGLSSEECGLRFIPYGCVVS